MNKLLIILLIIFSSCSHKIDNAVCFKEPTKRQKHMQQQQNYENHKFGERILAAAVVITHFIAFKTLADTQTIIK